MHATAPDLQFEMLPSSHGAMLLWFQTHEDREWAVAMQPIVHEGARMDLERCEESTNRFHKKPELLAYLSVREFPRNTGLWSLSRMLSDALALWWRLTLGTWPVSTTPLCVLWLSLNNPMMSLVMSGYILKMGMEALST